MRFRLYATFCALLAGGMLAACGDSSPLVESHDAGFVSLGRDANTPPTQRVDAGTIVARDGAVADLCGNSRVDPGETCDDGNTISGDGCSSKCATESCGDGVVQQARGEQCDDGNTRSGDGCNATCQTEAGACTARATLLCGSSLSAATSSRDATSSLSGYSCVPWNESGPEHVYALTAMNTGEITVSITADRADLDLFVLPGGASCDPMSCIAFGDTTTTFMATAGQRYWVVIDGYDGVAGDYMLSVACAGPGGLCGNNMIDPGEQCDDGNSVSGDGCSASCTRESTCGNNRIDPGEECDDGNTVRGDGCSAGCRREVCGDGVLQTGLGEECDDGNVAPGDGCSATCRTEVSSCTPALTLGCEGIDSWNTDSTGSTSAVTSYPCSPWNESGREYTYRFSPIADAMVTVTLSGLTSDLDVFVLSGSSCAPNGCVAYGNSSATFPATGGSNYFVVVEGADGATGPYNIALTCGGAAPRCGDGHRDPGEDCDDGNTTSGDGCSSLCVNEPARCTSADSLICGGHDAWDTTRFGSTDLASQYGCVSWQEGGAEYVYSFVAPATQPVTAALTGMTTDLDVFVLEEGTTACAASTCVSYGNASATFSAVSGRRYFVVVDSPDGQSGAYTIDLTCN